MQRFSFRTIGITEKPGLPVLESCLLGEFAHRAVNDFSCASAAVRLARKRGSIEEQLDMLDRLADRLDALGHIQRLMQAPAPGQRIDLADQMQSLCQAMVAARYAEQNIALSLVVDEIEIEASQGWRLLMIITELLINAARHAFDESGGTVLVEMLVHERSVVCRIQDNGGGLPPDHQERGGYGSSVVRMLVREIDGILTAISSPAGTAMLLTVPLAD